MEHSESRQSHCFDLSGFLSAVRDLSVMCEIPICENV